MSWIEAYGCCSAAGDSTADFSTALHSGVAHAVPWGKDPGLRTFLFPQRGSTSTRELLSQKLLLAFAQVQNHLDLSHSFGVILASTKGMSEDFVWSGTEEALATDPLTPLLEDFLRQSALRPARSVCVSNACSSALGAMALAQLWLAQGLNQVLVLAADAVTPFVLAGFQTLKLLSATGVRPFAADRDGFYLGEASAALLLSRNPSRREFFLHPVGLDSEGAAVSRPSHSGASLVRAAKRIPNLGGAPPEILIAHGTGTRINDQTEDLAFQLLFGDEVHRPSVTGTKWCVGHTLAVSGALDMIAACEALRHQRLFRLATTREIDPDFRAQYLSAEARLPENFSRIMVSSLGFGGMHASGLIERGPS